MGTFHHDKGELHGMTVVVQTGGPTVYIGRCDTQSDQGIVLLDADVYEGEASEEARQAWIQRAARVGVWKKLDQLFVPAREIASVRRLSEIRGG